MAKYIKKPMVIEAIQYIGENLQEIMEFLGQNRKAPPIEGMTLIINTLEGNMRCNVNDWVIKGIEGEFYSCKDSVFRNSYDKVEDQQCSNG